MIKLSILFLLQNFSRLRNNLQTYSMLFVHVNDILFYDKL